MKKKKWIKQIIGFVVWGGILLGSGRAQAFVFDDKVDQAKSLAHYTMGYIYDLEGSPQSAALEYEQAAQFDETSYLIHLRLGTDYARLGMTPEAVKEIVLAQKYNPGDIQSHYLLALIYSTQNDFDKAAAEYEFILKSFAQAEPENVEIYTYLGQLYYSQRKYDQAIQQFEKILKLESRNPDVLYLLGSLYLEINNENKAVELLRKSLEIDPDHDGSLNTLGYLYAEKKENLDEAQTLIQHALKLSPDNGAYLDSLGWVYYQKGMYEKALEYLLKADGALKDPVIYDHLGDVYFKLNRLDEAVKYWGLSLDILPKQEEVVKKLNEVKAIQASR